MSTSSRISPASIWSVAVLGMAVLLASGCATTSPTSTGGATAAAETQVAYPTGSRISRTVSKGTSAGIAKDAPGAVTGTSGVAREQNDMQTQNPITSR